MLSLENDRLEYLRVERTFFLHFQATILEVKFLANGSAVPLACHPSLGGDARLIAARLSLPPHQSLVHSWPQVKDVVTDCQVVLQPEGLQDNPVPDRERQAQLIVVVGWDRRGRESVNFPFSICSAITMCIFIQNSNKVHSDLLLGLTLQAHTHKKIQSEVILSSDWYNLTDTRLKLRARAQVFYCHTLHIRAISFQPSTETRHGKNSWFLLQDRFYVQAYSVGRRLKTNLLKMSNRDNVCFPCFEQGSTSPN